jgi:hypothetical protein
MIALMLDMEQLLYAVLLTSIMITAQKRKHQVEAITSCEWGIMRQVSIHRVPVAIIPHPTSFTLKRKAGKATHSEQPCLPPPQFCFLLSEERLDE